MIPRARWRTRRSQRGMTYIEVLVAALVMGISLAGMVSMWYFSFNLTVANDSEGIAYNIGRQAMEQTRIQGFVFAPEGVTTTFYNNSEAVVTSTDPSRSLLLNVSVVSSAVSSGTAGYSGAVPADAALRTVTITVTRLSDTRLMYTTSTYLVKYGI